MATLVCVAFKPRQSNENGGGHIDTSRHALTQCSEIKNSAHSNKNKRIYAYHCANQTHLNSNRLRWKKDGID